MKKINEMMISAYLKGMSKLNAFKDLRTMRAVK